ELDEKDRFLEAELRAVELKFPNLPHETAPDGKDETENVVRREWGTKPESTKPHWEIATELGIIDFDRASKISGSGFAVYVGQGAKLVRALIA
ncbi:serine--tRNA ligase, partial [Acinetobacter baumannii]